MQKYTVQLLAVTGAIHAPMRPTGVTSAYLKRLGISPNFSLPEAAMRAPNLDSSQMTHALSESSE